MHLKYFTFIFAAFLLSTPNKLNAKTYRGRTNGAKRVEQYPEKMEDIMFQYDFLTPRRLEYLDKKYETQFVKDFSKTNVSVFISPHEKPFNPSKWLRPNSGNGLDLITDAIIHTTARFNPEDENFHSVHIINKKTNEIVCKPEKVRTLKMNQALVDKYDQIIDRDDYSIRRYNPRTIVAIAEFAPSCFTLPKDERLGIIIAAKGSTGKCRRGL
ncbi:MAG: hypothetical protein HRT47_10910 [Candidatus Caenarcaniphilales bacterium]|nr:hypothetical protein [Candidatus Caenarcaniphilales bacterium]